MNKLDFSHRAAAALDYTRLHKTTCNKWRLGIVTCHLSLVTWVQDVAGQGLGNRTGRRREQKHWDKSERESDRGTGLRTVTGTGRMGRRKTSEAEGTEETEVERKEGDKTSVKPGYFVLCHPALLIGDKRQTV